MPQDKLDPEIYHRDQHSISRTQIDVDALKIMRRLIRSGHKGYLVGGGVRDLILGRAPKDYDIATDATPRKIKSLFRNCRIIGRRFKLAHIYFRGSKIIEVATFRQNQNDESEQSEQETITLARDNSYGDEASDALRRDLTINGLFYDLATFSIVDYVGGVQDLNDRIVRIIGEPRIRYLEDPVRMLRVARHAGRTGFSIDSATANEAINNGQLLKNVAPVRIYEEIKKDLTSGYLFPIFKTLRELKLLEIVVPKVAEISPSIWEPENNLGSALIAIDELYRTTDLDSVTPALIALIDCYSKFIHNTQYLSEVIHSDEDIDHLITTTFQSLLVPRKEKDKLKDAIRVLVRFETDGVDAFKDPRASRNNLVLKDLSRYLNAVGHPEYSTETHVMLRTLIAKKKTGVNKAKRNLIRRT